MAIRQMVNAMLSFMYSTFDYEGFTFTLMDVVFAGALLSLVSLAFAKLIIWFRNGGE